MINKLHKFKLHTFVSKVFLEIYLLRNQPKLFFLHLTFFSNTLDIDSISAREAGSGVFLAGLDLDQSIAVAANWPAADLVGGGVELRREEASVHCWWICWRINRFQDWIMRGTEVREMELASEKMRPRAEASGMVLNERRKLAGWQGIPWPTFNYMFQMKIYSPDSDKLNLLWNIQN